MRIVLADIKGQRGFVQKDVVVGGYGARLSGFSTLTKIASTVWSRGHDEPSVILAHLAAIFDGAGHEVVFTRDAVPRAEPGDVAIVLSSLVDYRNEIAWADLARAAGIRVGFVGLAASKLPQLFDDHADFVVEGEPESAAMRMAGGEVLAGRVKSEEVKDLDSLPLPRWDLIGVTSRSSLGNGWARPIGGLPVLASRSCPEHCTYCPHRILTSYRYRSVASVLDELELIANTSGLPVVFRDPLFSNDRERCLALADGILARGIKIQFECETRLDRLDDKLLERLRAAGLRAIEFGVESVSPEILKKVGRRPIPEAQQRRVIATCNRLGIRTLGFYVLGLPTDTWESIAATIDYSISLGSTLAQFKLLTPYPGTPLFKQLKPLVYETDWEKFDGFTPTFKHPSLSVDELMFLLGAAYDRFFLRPSFVANYLRVEHRVLRGVVDRLDRTVSRWHAAGENREMQRAVTS